jgi:hypothetical protein
MSEQTEGDKKKQGILVYMPLDKLARMKKTMKKERITNQTAFIINAVDTVCSEQEKISAAEKVENSLSILVENARIDRENAAKRHTEVMAYLDTLADAVLGGDEDDKANFKAVVQTKIQQRRGTT